MTVLEKYGDHNEQVRVRLDISEESLAVIKSTLKGYLHRMENDLWAVDRNIIDKFKKAVEEIEVKDKQ